MRSIGRLITTTKTNGHNHDRGKTQSTQDALDARGWEKLLAFTVKEGGTWHYAHDRHSIGPAHSLMFENGEQWDEVNGWRGNKMLPTFILWTPPGEVPEEYGVEDLRVRG